MNDENEKAKKRKPGWVKALDVFLRTCHIGVASVLFGGIVWRVPFERMLHLWHPMAVGTGFALAVSGVLQSRHWPYQVRGVMAAVHAGLLAVVHFRRELMVPVVTVVLILGVVGSNMPGYLRRWSLLHGARVD
jgi:hypothetical protein